MGQRATIEELRTSVGPLPPGDIVDVIAFAFAAPPRVDVAELIVLPTLQGRPG